MNNTKRFTDIFIAVVIFALLAPVLLVTALVILVSEGRPVLYISDRSHSPEKTFRLVKFRTMRPDENDSGASGGHKSGRVTRTGAFLRKSRLDETPQLWNILMGDMSFVGPRPPLPVYVERFPKIYSKVLKCRPGVTGLASLYFHQHEENLLLNCKTQEENDAVYEGICIPRKAQIDLMYLRNQSFCFDGWIMLATVFRSLR